MRKQCKVLKSIKPHFSLCFWINFFYLSFGGFCVSFLSIRDSVVIRLRTRFFFMRRILCYFFSMPRDSVVIRLRTLTFFFMRRRSFGGTEPRKTRWRATRVPYYFMVYISNDVWIHHFFCYINEPKFKLTSQSWCVITNLQSHTAP